MYLSLANDSSLPFYVHVISAFDPQSCQRIYIVLVNMVREINRVRSLFSCVEPVTSQNVPTYMPPFSKTPNTEMPPFYASLQLHCWNTHQYVIWYILFWIQVFCM